MDVNAGNFTDDLAPPPKEGKVGSGQTLYVPGTLQHSFSLFAFRDVYTIHYTACPKLDALDPAHRRGSITHTYIYIPQLPCSAAFNLHLDCSADVFT